MQIVDDTLSFVKATRGKPSRQESALFMSAVAMSYATWENYIEQLSLETVEFLASVCEPAQVPAKVAEYFNKQSAWTLSHEPGWQRLWVEWVQEKAVGSGQTFGMNTANKGQVNTLFERVGVSPFVGVADVDKLATLVEHRGAIVHTAQPPKDGFKKADAVGWRDYVATFHLEVDRAVRTQVFNLCDRYPW